MSPGATFERVYHELKRMLAEGELPPGTPIEPALIGKQIASSITPIRDALHRLTGERLVEAPNHNGFRVPLLTEAGLRDLYNWNGMVARAAAKHGTLGLGEIERPISDADVPRCTAALFRDIANRTGSSEIMVAVGSLNDRLAPFRRAEVVALGSGMGELIGLASVVSAGDRTALMGAITRYHRRRVAAVIRIVAQATNALVK